MTIYDYSKFLKNRIFLGSTRPFPILPWYGYVYISEFNEQNKFKIGITRDMTRRDKEMQVRTNESKMRFSWSSPAREVIETSIKNLFKNFILKTLEEEGQSEIIFGVPLQVIIYIVRLVVLHRYLKLKYVVNDTVMRKLDGYFGADGKIPLHEIILDGKSYISRLTIDRLVGRIDDYFLVRWKGYQKEHDTWESVETLEAKYKQELTISIETEEPLLEIDEYIIIKWLRPNGSARWYPAIIQDIIKQSHDGATYKIKYLNENDANQITNELIQKKYKFLYDEDETVTNIVLKKEKLITKLKKATTWERVTPLKTKEIVEGDNIVPEYAIELLPTQFRNRYESINQDQKHSALITKESTMFDINAIYADINIPLEPIVSSITEELNSLKF